MGIRTRRRRRRGRSSEETEVQETKRRKAAESSSLSLPDDLIMEVLARLPASSVARFRCACRSWNAETSSPAFLGRHHALSPGKLSFVPLVPPHNFPATVYIPGATRQPPRPWAFVCAGCPVIVGSKPCRGVVLVRKLCARTAAAVFSVYNLTTGEMLRLPPWRTISPPVGLIEGIGFDAAAGVYKVVRVAASPARSFRCIVLTLGDPRGWRTLTCNATTGGGGFLGLTGHAEIDDNRHNAGAVFADGCIHWSFKTDRWYVDKPHGVLSFSLADETFRRVAQPPFATADAVPYHGSEVIKHSQQGRMSESGGGEGRGMLPVGTTLAELDGRLCLVRDVRLRDDVAGQFEIWKLEDYDAGTWSLDYRVDVAGHRAAKSLTTSWLVVPLRYLPGGSLGGKRKLLLSTTAQAAHVYDPDKNTLETVASLAGRHDVVIGGGDGVSVRGFDEYMRLLLYQENLVRFAGMESGKKDMIKFVKLSDCHISDKH
ncbi:unnamed protein product [Urochloa decumbens]|uniref:F-box domain-containing protein n=1 Tax=Urochloa decumbens TaxID=240449 RepID=A0ABC9D7J7_9POAL